MIAAAAGILLCAAFTQTGCKSCRTTPEQSESPVETAQTTVPETTQIPVQESTQESTAVPETEPVTIPTKSENVIRYRTFFGKTMQDQVAELNLRTLATEGSMLFDVLSDETYTAERILQMIESYSLNSFVTLNGQPFTDEQKQALDAYRNLEGLRTLAADKKTIDKQWAILTENANVRSFPTEDVGLSAGMDPHFDLFQETKLLYATGVQVLWHTADWKWYFVQGENYYGWIKAEDFAFCSFEDFEFFVSPSDFLVTVSTGGSKPWHRMGVILPMEQTVSKDGGYQVRIPVRNSDGTLKKQLYILGAGGIDEGEYNLGFLEFSNESLRQMMTKMIGVPYGWGDMDNEGRMAYDCSSTVNSALRVFGIYMPRNSSCYKYSGAEVIDVSGMSTEEKYRVLEEHPVAALMAPGHVMFNDHVYNETSSDPQTKAMHSIIHNTSMYGTKQRTDAGEQIVSTPFYECVRTEFEEMYRNDNTDLYITKLALVIDFEAATSPALKKY